MGAQGEGDTVTPPSSLPRKRAPALSDSTNKGNNGKSVTFDRGAKEVESSSFSPEGESAKWMVVDNPSEGKPEVARRVSTPTEEKPKTRFHEAHRRLSQESLTSKPRQANQDYILSKVLSGEAQFEQLVQLIQFPNIFNYVKQQVMNDKSEALKKGQILEANMIEKHWYQLNEDMEEARKQLFDQNEVEVYAVTKLVNGLINMRRHQQNEGNMEEAYAVGEAISMCQRMQKNNDVSIPVYTEGEIANFAVDSEELEYVLRKFKVQLEMANAANDLERSNCLVWAEEYFKNEVKNAQLHKLDRQFFHNIHDLDDVTKTNLAALIESFNKREKNLEEEVNRMRAELDEKHKKETEEIVEQERCADNFDNFRLTVACLDLQNTIKVLKKTQKYAEASIAENAYETLLQREYEHFRQENRRRYRSVKQKLTLRQEEERKTLEMKIKKLQAREMKARDDAYDLFNKRERNVKFQLKKKHFVDKLLTTKDTISSPEKEKPVHISKSIELQIPIAQCQHCGARFGQLYYLYQHYQSTGHWKKKEDMNPLENHGFIMEGKKPSASHALDALTFKRSKQFKMKQKLLQAKDAGKEQQVDRRISVSKELMRSQYKEENRMEVGQAKTISNDNRAHFTGRTSIV